MKHRKYLIPEICMILFTMLMISPLLIMVFGAFKDSVGAAAFDFTLPKQWEFGNFSFVIQNGNVVRAFINSLILTGFTTVFGVLLAAMAAFVIVRKDTKGSKGIYNYFLIGMIAPLQIITTYAVLKVLHLNGTFIGLIMVYIAVNLPFNFFLFCSFIKGIPRELDESGFMDGASQSCLFFKIIFPLLKPVTATSIVILAMSVWNDFQLPLYLLNTPKKWTLPLTVYNFYGQYYSKWNYVFADCIITAVPILIVYLFAQKYIVEGMTSGAVKG
ncbi:MAG: carbohydrate ABC transporter permease [Eubacteriales bacterium]|nr:carbohydrate ABC transporter permease [Eubacteriales bacterium]